MSEIVVILCTCPDDRVATELARGLVSECVAACVNVLPGIRSIYRWQDNVEEASEVLMVVKTTTAGLPRAEAWLQERHPYDVPEIVAVSASHVAAPYLEWLAGQVHGSPGLKQEW